MRLGGEVGGGEIGGEGGGAILSETFGIIEKRMRYGLQFGLISPNPKIFIYGLHTSLMLIDVHFR